MRDKNDAVIVIRDFLKLWLGGMSACPVDTLIRFTSYYLLVFPH